MCKWLIVLKGVCVRVCTHCSVQRLVCGTSSVCRNVGRKCVTASTSRSKMLQKNPAGAVTVTVVNDGGDHSGHVSLLF